MTVLGSIRKGAERLFTLHWHHDVDDAESAAILRPLALGSRPGTSAWFRAQHI
jgi:hypothetical protein